MRAEQNNIIDDDDPLCVPPQLLPVYKSWQERKLIKFRREVKLLSIDNVGRQVVFS